jgi:hypothetical protein
MLEGEAKIRELIRRAEIWHMYEIDKETRQWYYDNWQFAA